MTFDDIDMRFSEKEWSLLGPSQKALYSEEMLNIYKMAASLGNDAFFRVCVDMLYGVACVYEKYTL